MKSPSPNPPAKKVGPVNGWATIDNIALPLKDEDPKYRIAPDIESAMEYYPKYVAHAVRTNVRPLKPAAYFMTLSEWYFGKEDLMKQMAAYQSWIGQIAFFEQMEANLSAYNSLVS